MSVIVVTGGSRGIGAATARKAAAAGYDVAVGFRHDDRAAHAVAADCRSHGVKSIPVQADVSQEVDVVAMFERVDAAFGGVDCLVNNAGIVHRQARLEDFSSDRLHEVMGVNVIGAFLCAREAVRRMSTRRGGSGGSIVNVSSAASVLGSPNEYIDYAASKGALDTMTIGLAKEVADVGIRVNAVRPGLIATDIHASGGEPGRVDRLSATVPMKRGGTPGEVAAVIMFLASDEAAYVTGSLVDVSGGR